MGLINHHFSPPFLGNIFFEQIQVLEWDPFGKNAAGFCFNSQYFRKGLMVLLGCYDSRSIHVMVYLGPTFGRYSTIQTNQM